MHTFAAEDANSIIPGDNALACLNIYQLLWFKPKSMQFNLNRNQLEKNEKPSDRNSRHRIEKVKVQCNQFGLIKSIIKIGIFPKI